MTREKILSVAKPILFNTEMVRAILEGRKTETRRLIKPPYFVDGDLNDPRSLQALRTAPKGSWLYRQIGRMPYPDDPYKIGRYMYVRETWGCYTENWGDASYFLYRADYPDEATTYQYDDHTCDIPKWRPSIHMPKEAARIFLRVTDVRVERLRDIGNCTKEGIAPGTHATAHMNYYDERCAFAALWDSTIPKKDLDKYGWDASPWVWVIQFERVEML